MTTRAEKLDRIPRASFAGLKFAKLAQDEAVRWFVSYVTDLSRGRDEPHAIRFVNAWCVVMADRDKSYRALLSDSGLNFADGMPVARFLRGARLRTSFRVRGPSFFRDALDHGRSANVAHYLYGGSDETIRALQAAVERDYPGARIVGAEAPPFASARELTGPDVSKRIVESGADVVWIGLGSPKQDFVGKSLAMATGIPAVSVGAAFDFVAGTSREAPPWVQRLGLEWAYRFAIEPRRLWKRYLIGNIHFVYIALRSCVSRVRPEKVPRSSDGLEQ